MDRDQFLNTFVFLILPYFIFPIANDITLNGFSKQLYQIELPNTEILQKHSTCGKLVGNRNGMDYLACVLVKTDLAYEELVTEFDQQNFKPAKPGAALHYGGHREVNSIISTEVLKVDDDKLKSKYLNTPLRLEPLKNENDYSNCYALVIFDGGYSALFDIRGH